MSPLLLLFAGLSAADAHRPHSVVVAMAVDPDIASTGRAWVVQNPHDVALLMRTDDAGQTWEFVGGAPQDSELIGAGHSGDRLVLLGDRGELWMADRGGQDWSLSLLRVSAQALAVSGTHAYVAAREGLVSVPLDDPGAAVIDETSTMRVIAADPVDDAAVVAAALDGNTLLYSDDAGASTVALPSLSGETLIRIWSLATADGIVYAGTDQGLFWLDVAEEAPAWSACPTPPFTPTTGGYTDDIVALGFSENGSLLAAGGTEAVARAADGCGGWTVLPAEDDFDYGGIGNISDPREAFVGLYLDPDVGLAAGFNGVAVSADGGASWRDAVLLPEDYTKGVAFAPGFPDDPRFFSVGYGGGVHWTDDGGASWSGSAVGVAAAYSNDITAIGDGVLFYSGSNTPYRSLDDGETWAGFTLPMSRVRQFRGIGDRVYALGEDQAGGIVGQLAWSDDSGESWSEFPALYRTSAAAPRDVQEIQTAAGDTQLLVVVDQPAGLVRSTDDGTSWQILYSGEAEPAAGAQAWPPGAAERLLFASPSSGVLLSDDDGASWRPPSTGPGEHIRHLLQTDDGTLFATDRRGQIFRSLDGGEVWASVGEPIGPAIYCADFAEDFAETGYGALGTQAGIFFTADGGESWSLMSRYQRLEAGAHLLACEDSSGDECPLYVEPGHSLGGGYLLDAGTVLRFRFDGTGLRLVTDPSAEGALSLTVNGADEGALTLDEQGARWESDGASGWQDVVLTVTSAEEPVRLDLVEVWGGGAVMPLPGGGDSGGDSASPDTSGGSGDPPAEERCGCRSGDQAGALVVWGLLAGLSARRRRRRSPGR